MKKALLIFAKEPVPGTVKTRLARDLDVHAAAELYAAMLGDVLETAVSLSDVRPLVFWALETGTVPGCPEFPGLEMFEQQGVDLGEKMRNAFIHAFGLGFETCCCIGSDMPDLAIGHIRQAFRNLESPEADVVFGPAADGGYYLVGMKKMHPHLFADIAWSTPAVLATSLERARGLGLRTSLLEPWYDIDTLDDLARLLGTGATNAPRTRRAAAGLLRDRDVTFTTRTKTPSPLQGHPPCHRS